VGTDLGSFLLRSRQHFLPVTDASIRWSAAAIEEIEETPVVLVNTSELREDAVPRDGRSGG